MTGPKISTFALIEQLCQKVAKLEDELDFVKSQFNHSSFSLKQQLLRIKNKDELSDYYILDSLAYRDLSPEKSFELYCKKNIDFTILDVSEQDFKSPNQIKEALCIPLEELESKHFLLGSKKREILVISENGVRSIRACKKLSKLGYFRVNNISGGHKFWPSDSSYILLRNRA